MEGSPGSPEDLKVMSISDFETHPSHAEISPASLFVMTYALFDLI